MSSLFREFVRVATAGVLVVVFLIPQDALADSHVVSIHLLLHDETRGFLSRDKIANLRKGVIHGNTARGAIVDEAALVRALQAKQIAGAGLDVFEHEPKVDKRLKTMANVVLTPHLGSAVADLRDTMANIVVDNIAAVIEGRIPPNCVNPEIYARGR